MNVGRRDSAERQCSPDDELIDALVDRRRREVLRVLRDEQGTTVDGLVASLAGGERTIASLSDDAGQLRTRLRHVDLPKLAASGLIEFEPETDRTRRRDWRPLVHRILESADRAPRCR